MKLVVKRNREIAPINSQNTQNENRAETIELIVPEEYESFNKKIVFITPNETVWDVITNNKYKITNAITQYDKVDYYIWLTKEVDGESIDFRTKTKTLNFYHNEDASDEITDEEIHGVNTVVNLLEEEIDKVENLNIEATKVGDTATITITKKDGTTKEVEINDGQDGYTPQKGTDYFTQEDIEEIETDVKNDLEENVLVNYSLIAETGAKIELSINTTNYKLTAILKDKNNATICTSNEIDLPLETMVVNATYDNTTKKIILTLQNGTTVEFSVADLVSGLVSESQLQTILSNFYNKTEINNLLNNKVDKVQGKELSSNDFTDALKEKLEGLENYDDTAIKADISDIQDEQTEQNTDIEKLQTENARLKATLPTTGEVTGQTITLDKTAEFEFIKPPLPMGNSEQVQYSGKNLFSGNYSQFNSVGGTGNIYSYFKLPEDGETYTLSLKAKNDFTAQSGNNLGFTANGGDATNGYQWVISNGVTVSKGNILKFSTSTYRFISLYYANSDVLKTLTDNFEIQLEKGSTRTEYEPYTGGTASPNPDYPQEITNVTGDVEVVVENKNLWDEVLETGGYNLTTGQKEATNNYRNANYIGINPNNEICLTKPIGIATRVFFYDKNKAFISAPDVIYTNQLASVFTTPNNAYYMNFRLANGYGTTYNNDICINVSNPSINGTYVPHQHQTFIFPLGNEKLMLGDYLADDVIHHVRGQVVLDGTEGWEKNSVYSNVFYLNNVITNRKINIINALSNYFIYGGLITSSATVEVGKFYLWGTNEYIQRIVVGCEKDTLTEFKTWLSTHNTTVEYELEQEVIVSYTSTQQEVYNAIKQVLSYEEQTNISGTSDGSNPIFSVEGYQNTKLVLKEMATAIVALGGV